ncbi:MAG: XRE family transcriptional regulator [Aaplasma endosymbiont of Hyalomma asiaticum]
MTEERRENGQNVKLQILSIIRETIRRSQWSQMTAAKVIGVDQPKVSQIINGKATGFSLERLLVFLLRLRCKIELSIQVGTHEISALDNPEIIDLNSIDLVITSKNNY